MLSVVLILLVSVGFLLLASEGLISGSKMLAHRLGISPLIIALTIVAIGTSLPELVVSSTAILGGDPGLAMGNIVGSNVVNGTLLFGIAVLSGKLRIGTQKTQRNAIVLMIITVIFVSIRATTHFPIFQGTVLILLAFMIGSYQRELVLLEKLGLALHQQKKHPLYKTHLSVIALIVVASGVTLAVAGSQFVFALEKLSVLLGLSTTVLGLTLSAFATSIPELLTTVVAMVKRESKIAIGNILGSNIYNLSLIGGVISFHPQRNLLEMPDVVILLIATLFLVSVIRYWSGKYVPKKIGILALLFFLIFIASSFLRESIYSQTPINPTNLTGEYDSRDVLANYYGQQFLTREFPSSSRTHVLGSTDRIKHIEVDLSTQRLYAYEGNEKVYDFLISSGKWGRTPTGSFTVWGKFRYTKMEGGKKELNTYYYLPNVPYVMFFSNDEIAASRGFSLHGTYWHSNFGHPMSHGCINMKTEEAGIIYDWIEPYLGDKKSGRATEENPGTMITIYGVAPKE